MLPKVAGRNLQKSGETGREEHVSKKYGPIAVVVHEFAGHTRENTGVREVRQYFLKRPLEDCAFVREIKGNPGHVQVYILP